MVIRMLRTGDRDGDHAQHVRGSPPVGGIGETLPRLRARQRAAMVGMISASVRLLRYGGRLFPTKSVVAPDSNLFVPVLTTSVLMLLPPLQGTSTGAARSMPGLRVA